MSVFASETVNPTLDIPNAPGQTVTIRKLTRAEFRKVIDSADVVAAAIRAGVVSWSFPQPVEAAAIDDLDFDAAEFIGGEVIFLAKPSMRPVAKDATETAGEADRKNA